MPAPGNPEAGAPPRRPPVSTAFLETVIPSVVLLWRAWIMRPIEVVQDVVAIVALYWLLLRLVGGRRAWRPITVLFMAALLAIYAYGQGPLTLAMLRKLP